ncbi:DNA translocase FtsK [Irregularibacter muris]|uniref:DNA translocase FtsK n=1 Tax=Irregularibacter muris TaxID=1796619 RepID=A0AAE3HFB5_9FIRM|nr:DNA translocase FtsK [Irregularibacter muris]MCR1898093.1 DNA translocase FtsK [Irregularibacter muris]
MATKKRKKKKNKNNILKHEIIGLINLAMGIYGTYAVFIQNPGRVGMSLKFILGFILGKGSILFTLVLTFISLSLVIKCRPFKWSSKLSGIVIIIINYCILQYIFIVENLVSSPLNLDVIKISWNNAPYITRGGIIGLFFASTLDSLFSTVGSLIIILLGFAISFILLTQKSFMGYTKKVIETIHQWIKTVIDSILNFIKKPKDEPVKVIDSTPKSGDVENKIQQLDKKIKILDYTQEGDRNNPLEEDMQGMKEVALTEKEEEVNKISSLNYIHSEYKIPSINLLNNPAGEKVSNDKRQVINNARVLEKTLMDFGVKAKVVQVNMGPTITRYELQPSPGVKVSKIINLTDDIALNLAASGVRIEAPIPGKAAIGIEVPNPNTSTVFIRELIESDQFESFSSELAFAVGKDIAGQVLVTDLSKMPHMLIAGATGSGKSVCINSLITSILYKSTPDQVRLILIDPKVVELSVYNGIPHLLIPVVTDPKKAAGALNWAIQEMTDRYKKFAECGVRDLGGYNEMFKNDLNKKMPKILVIIDELADLMMVSPHEVEDAICRLAQMARAAGIHLVVATQRPSVDVITGVIKANIPSRVAFAVSSQMDSRTILDMGGAEKLLGKGDMLFYPVGTAKPMRIQGAFISDKEVEQIVEYIKSQNEVEYNHEIIEEIQSKNSIDTNSEDDELLPQAIELAIENQQISISMLQRRLRIGYARAARIIDEMEERNIIGGYEGSKPRKVLMQKEETQG